MLNSSQIEALAEGLFQQHERREIFKGVGDLIPTMDDAHNVQDAYVAKLLKKYGTTVGGYKIALTSKQTRDWLKIHEPAAGQVLATRIYHSPYTEKASAYVRFSVETEVCVILDKDMSGPTTVDAVRANMRSVHCAYELIEDRGADLTRLDGQSLASDNAWNNGIVIGPAGPLDLDLTNRKGRLKVDGKVTQEGTTAETMSGNPLDAVVWLSGHLGKRGGKIKAGQPIITGSIVQSQFIEPGHTLEFALDGMPPVILHLT